MNTSMQLLYISCSLHLFFMILCRYDDHTGDDHDANVFILTTHNAILCNANGKLLDL